MRARGGGVELCERLGTGPAAARLDPPLVRLADVVLHVREIVGHVLARERVTQDEALERGEVHEVVLDRPPRALGGSLPLDFVELVVRTPRWSARPRRACRPVPGRSPWCPPRPAGHVARQLTRSRTRRTAWSGPFSRITSLPSRTGRMCSSRLTRLIAAHTPLRERRRLRLGVPAERAKEGRVVGAGLGDKRAEARHEPAFDVDLVGVEEHREIDVILRERADPRGRAPVGDGRPAPGPRRCRRSRANTPVPAPRTRRPHGNEELASASWSKLSGNPLRSKRPRASSNAVREEEAVGADHRDVVGERVVRSHAVGQRGRARRRPLFPTATLPVTATDERHGPAGPLGDHVGQRSVDLDLVGVRRVPVGTLRSVGRATTCRPLVPVEVHVAAPRRPPRSLASRRAGRRNAQPSAEIWTVPECGTAQKSTGGGRTPLRFAACALGGTMVAPDRR